MGYSAVHAWLVFHSTNGHDLNNDALKRHKLSLSLTTVSKMEYKRRLANVGAVGMGRQRSLTVVAWHGDGQVLFLPPRA